MFILNSFLFIFVAFHIIYYNKAGTNRCDVCKENKSTCHIISGLFTRPQLPIGYNIITRIPRGACNLSVSELQRSLNYLALRRTDGSFIINGNWVLNWSGHYLLNDTHLLYIQENETNLESIYSSGPLKEPLDLMVIYQQPNPGIKYNYQLPISQDSDIFLKDDPVIAPPYLRHTSGFRKNSISKVVNENGINTIKFNKQTLSIGGIAKDLREDVKKQRNIKNRKRKFSWKVTGYTKCSRLCGGGVQTPLVQCIRTLDQIPVSSRRCVSQNKHTLRCNVKPCLAQWVGEEWSECSVSCGKGVQRRRISCRQEITPMLILHVAEAACLTPPSPLLRTTQVCNMQPCPENINKITPQEWNVGKWSECSTKCGLGIRTRHVTCNIQNCSMTDRPTWQSVCDMGSCDNKWFYTDWSTQCSSSCGRGEQTRKVICFGNESECDPMTRLDNSRSCSSEKACNGQWYTGPWGQCTAKCGKGKQARNVLCLAKLNSEFIVTSEDTCLSFTKPSQEQDCYIQPCEPQWYISNWSQCSKTCDSGMQVREVKCFDESHRISNRCSDLTTPASRQYCNTHRCILPDETNNNITLNDVSQNQSTTIKTFTKETSSLGQPISNEIEECVDIFSNCQLVVQARLCRYTYYSSSCCHSCFNKLKL